MFKLVVLSALVAVAVAAPHPGHLAVAAPLAYTSHVVAPAVSVPTAVSHSSRTDVHHKGVIATTYTAPAVVAAPVVHTAYAAPAVVAAPAVHTAYAAPAVVAAPAFQTYAAPAVHTAYAAPVVAAPAIHTAYAAPVVSKVASVYTAGVHGVGPVVASGHYGYAHY